MFKILLFVLILQVINETDPELKPKRNLWLKHFFLSVDEDKG